MVDAVYFLIGSYRAVSPTVPSHPAFVLVSYGQMIDDFHDSVDWEFTGMFKSAILYILITLSLSIGTHIHKKRSKMK